MTTTGLLQNKNLKAPSGQSSRVRKTKAAVLFKTGKIRIVTLTIPKLQPGQVLVDVAYSGVCGSQLLEVFGKRGPDRFLPHTLGHEGSGIVLEIGKGVKKVRPGDRVILSWIKGTGADVPSTVYKSTQGFVNSGAISTLMRQTVTCENRVFLAPEDIPLRAAALFGCAIPTGFGIVKKIMKIKVSSRVAVFGVGGIGLSTILAAHLTGAKEIIAVDIFDHKLDYARKLGATHTINARHEDPLRTIKMLTQGCGVDYAVEAAGNRKTMEIAFRVVRIDGGLCILAGNLPHGQRMSIDPLELIRGKRLMGTWGGETNLEKDLEDYANLLRANKFSFNRLPIQTYSLDETSQALQDQQQGRTLRAVIDMSLNVRSKIRTAQRP